jgi:endonuclease G
VYGGGGNATATYKNDFIELFNRGTSPVNVTGWSVQYASAAGTSWAKTDLTGTIQPGRYYLVQESAGAGGTVNLPTPDASGGIAMSATAGKVALVTNGTLLTCGTANNCLPNAAIRDLVGFGTGSGGANSFEGAAPAPTLTNPTAAIRAGGGCTDSDNNGADFSSVAANPRNSASAANICGVVTNNPPTINAPANPAATVAQDAAPFNVGLSGSDDGGIYNWSATAGTGVASVVINGGQGTANITYKVTLQAGFTGTAKFTASLSDNVNPPATQIVNITVSPVVVVNNPPTITAPANPAATVAQDAAPFTITLNGSDDFAVYNWSATAGAGVSAVTVLAGQGTSSVTYNVTLQTGFSGTATFTASLSDNVNTPAARAVNITVTPPPVNHVVISQIYGGGGNSGATYTNDYVELYNPTATAFTLTGWSIQYASATGTTWTLKQPIGGTLAPGEYYLVKLASGGAVGSPLPVDANITGDINMSATTGKIALVGNSDSLTGGACPVGTDPDLIDLVGYGTTANCHEGSANAPAPSNTTALFRKSGGATDTNQNGADFVTGAALPRRTAPIVELGPWVAGTDPVAGFTNIPHDATVTVSFSEPVDAVGAWYDINCTLTGAHNDATVSHASDFKSWAVTPNTNFQFGEQCTITVNKDAIHDQDSDDTGPNTDTLFENYVSSFTVVAEGSPAPYPPSVHLTMGNPSNATADLTEPNNYLMEKDAYTLSYNRDKGTPNWVSWHLESAWYGTLARNDTFRADPAVPADWYRVQATDYFTSGFDRGHMTPNADRDKETSIPLNQATFLMSNMVPQAPDNNQGPWADLEGYLRTLTDAGNEIYIVSGPAGIGGTGSSGFMTTIADGHVTVPASTWKVALIIPKGDDDVSRVTAATRTIAVIMPNTQGIRNVDWHTYLTTVDAVEQLSGYDLFSNLPDAVENSVEAGTDGSNPPGTADGAFTTAEDTPATVTMTAANPSSTTTLTYTIVSGPAHGTLSPGTGADRVYTPADNFSGTDSFTFRVSDGTRNSNTSTVSILVTEVNDAPVIADIPAQTVNENSSLTFTATATDADGPATTFSLTGIPPGFSNPPTITAAGVFTWTPTSAQIGTHVFNVQVSDGSLDDSTTVSVTVRDVTAPSLTLPSDITSEATGPQGAAVTYTATATDAHDGPLAVTCSPISGSTFAIDTTTVTCSASDASGNEAHGTFHVTVRDTTAPDVTCATADGHWHGDNVQIACTSTDGGAGLAEPSDAAFMLSTNVAGGSDDANASTGSREVCDPFHNCRTVGPISGNMVDRKAPVITASAAKADSSAYTAGEWTNQSVTVSYNCTDGAGSGVASSSAAQTLGGDGAHQTASGTCTDSVGHSAEATFVEIDIDKTAPVLTTARVTQANANGWNNTDVLVSYSATDGGSGFAPGGDSGTFTFTGEGANLSQTFTLNDRAGNAATTTLGGVNIDRTPPTINASRTPAANPAGWNNTNVVAAATSGDALSGIDPAASTLAPVTFSTDGANQTTTFHAVDKAGNSATTIVGNVNVDKTAPVLHCGAADALWHSADVSIPCTADGAVSGLFNAADASFSLATSVAAGTETASAATNSRTVCDVAGNCSTAGPVSNNKVDKKGPTVTINQPMATNYLLNQLVLASYTCADGGSGQATCTGPVANGSAFDTTLGLKAFTVTASDQAGNVTTKTVNYSVGYNITTLYDEMKANKSGSTIPIKLQVTNASGANLSSPGIVLTQVGVRKLSDYSTGEVVDPGTLIPDNDFKLTGDQYHYNLKTTGLTTGTYVLVFAISSDPLLHAAQFQVR